MCCVAENGVAQYCVTMYRIYSFPLDHKLASQVYLSFLFSKIYACSPSRYNFSSAPCIYIVFIT